MRAHPSTTNKREQGSRWVTKETGNCSSLVEEREGKEKVLVLANVCASSAPVHAQSPIWWLAPAADPSRGQYVKYVW